MVVPPMRTMTMYRTQFKTTTQGLDRRLVPMRLWEKPKNLGTWDPQAIDFSQDREDWQQLSGAEQDLLLRLTAQFMAGEESVTYDLLPLLQWAAETQRLEDEMFLTAYLWEEAKHVEAFHRFFEDVAQLPPEARDLSAYLTPAYQQIFYEAQPQAMQRLRTDSSPIALAEASVTYQLMTEGVLAETGYYAYHYVLQEHNILPGMQTLVQHISRDEARHLAYGVYLLSCLIAEHGDEIWDTIQARMSELILVAMTNITELLAPYDPVPFGVDASIFLDFALAQSQKRLAHVERARHQTLDAVRYDQLA